MYGYILVKKGKKNSLARNARTFRKLSLSVRRIQASLFLSNPKDFDVIAVRRM